MVSLMMHRIIKYDLRRTGQENKKMRPLHCIFFEIFFLEYFINHEVIQRNMDSHSVMTNNSQHLNNFIENILKPEGLESFGLSQSSGMEM